MKKHIASALLSMVLFSASAWAHGSGSHVMGTVTELDATHMVVQTAEGKSVPLQLDAETRYWNADAPAQRVDVAVGSRVAVDFTAANESLNATEVRFVRTAPEKRAAPEPHHRDEPEHHQH